MPVGAVAEATIVKTLLEWAWVGVCVLMGIIWRQHNGEIADIKASIDKVDGRIDSFERAKVPRAEYEVNRKEVREGQIAIYQRLDAVGQALARIEGKLDK